MQVVTKCAGNPCVMEFALDEEKFEKRSEEGRGNVYKDPIYVRDPGPSPEHNAQQVGLSAAASTSSGAAAVPSLRQPDRQSGVSRP